jgi:hypothetical protein
MQDDSQSNKDKNMLSDCFESEKYISDNSDTVEFNPNIDDNDSKSSSSSSSSSSSYTTDNEKNIKKNQKQNRKKRMTGLDHIKVSQIQGSYLLQLIISIIIRFFIN